MAVSYRIESKGFEKVQRLLKTLKPPTSDKAITAGLIGAAKAVAADAKLNQIIRGGAFMTSSIGVAAAAFNIKGGRADLKVNPHRLTSRSGNLRDSIVINRTKAPRSMEVGPWREYGRTHEFGFSGSVTVKLHQRQVVFGRKVAKKFDVGPYSRRMVIRARPFMKPALDKTAPSFSQIFLEEIAKRMPR
jgi:hypothetical protein